jgi:hypothetical protein
MAESSVVTFTDRDSWSYAGIVPPNFLISGLLFAVAGIRGKILMSCYERNEFKSGWVNTQNKVTKTDGLILKECRENPHHQSRTNWAWASTSSHYDWMDSHILFAPVE